MKKNPLLLVLGLCGAGLLSGIAARRLAHPAVRHVPEGPLAAPLVIPKKSAPAIPPMRSADTLETLAALPHGELYTRLAAWLVDADEPEIAAYWEGYRNGKRNNEITNLVFLNWTRLHPQAALAATAGTPDERYAWWAWTCHDPRGALAAALAAGPEQVKNVARGLGEFHPAWLRQHLSEIPEAARKDAFSGLAKWGDAENPLEMLKFAEQHRMNSGNSTFKALVSKDPWAALEWAREKRTGLEELVSQMVDERPDDLARLAEQSPSGEAKRKMEAALFANLMTLGGQFQAMPDEQKQQVAQVIADAVSHGDFDPPLIGEAIRYLLSRPPGTPVADEANKKIPWLREASSYAGNLAVTEPETARDWVQTLPEGEPKLWARLNVLTIWTQYDPKAADQWFKSLPANVQAGIQEIREKEK